MRNGEKINIQIRKIQHKGELRIGIFFDYCLSVKKDIKSLRNSTYSQTMKCWHLPNVESSYVAIHTLPYNIIYDLSTKDQEVRVGQYKENAITQKWLDLLTSYEQYLETKRYSPATIDSYLSILKLFFVWVKKNDIEDLNFEILERFNYEFFINGKYSKSYQNIWVNAAKLFLTKFTNYNIDINKLERPRPSKNLPAILSVDEVKRFIMSFANVKHRSIMLTIYACGLRKSELINLKIDHIDGERNIIRIKHSKGAKDRDIALPKELKVQLRQYYKEYKPKDYLFNGINGGPYSASSVDKLIKKGVKNAGISKHITTHSLRHSYATHLVERNINLRFIQDALGHKSSTTTEIYTKLSKDQISNMVSPIDFWSEQ